jgi:hypothetical protein
MASDQANHHVERLRIHWEVLDIIDGWALGSFYLILNGSVVGNSQDRSVDLRGCLAWLRDFVENDRDRFEPGLFEANKQEVYSLLACSVLPNEDVQRKTTEVYADTFSRFHISHIGMSSFNDVVLLLIKDRVGNERCVWKSGDADIGEAYFAADEIESVAKSTITKLEKELMPP